MGCHETAENVISLVLLYFGHGTGGVRPTLCQLFPAPSLLYRRWVAVHGEIVIKLSRYVQTEGGKWYNMIQQAWLAIEDLLLFISSKRLSL
jgi:hypothetical protein